jgi:hypothetical protein
MGREPRTRLPLAGLLIILVAPLATLMVIVPTLFAGDVRRVETAVPAIISRLVPNPSPHNDGHPPGHSLPPVAVAPEPASGPAGAAPGTPSSSGSPLAPPVLTPSPSPAVQPSPAPVETTTSAPRTNHGRRRRRRPHELLS